MSEVRDGIDMGGVLRALRRRADLSQRELAERSGVPQATLARIESGRARNPRLRTVERLVRAAGGALAIGIHAHDRTGATDRDGEQAPSEPASGEQVPSEPAPGTCRSSEIVPASPVPHDDLRDGAGRRYPAHLDVWEVREPRDWPGAWWADWYNLPPERYPLPLPLATYELNRRYRDNRRRRDEVRRTVRVRRVTGGLLPSTTWRFVAELPDGELVGELRAHERSPHLAYDCGDESGREMVLDGILVPFRYRRLGIGRRLVEALLDGMRQQGIPQACAIAEDAGIDLLLACGFRLEARRPAALRWQQRAWPGRSERR